MEYKIITTCMSNASVHIDDDKLAARCGGTAGVIDRKSHIYVKFEIFL
jgi:hypothetical protein